MKLLELFDKVQPVEWETDYDATVANFKTSEDVPYQIRFEPATEIRRPYVYEVGFQFDGPMPPLPDPYDYDSTEEWNRAFKREHAKQQHQRYGITGRGNQHEVISTVINSIEQFVKKNDPNGLIFTADEPSRQKLYSTITRKFGKDWITEKRGNRFLVFKRPQENETL